MLIVISLSAVIFFSSTSIAWGLTLATPQLLVLSNIAMNFATLAILGLPMSFFVFTVTSIPQFWQCLPPSWSSNKCLTPIISIISSILLGLIACIFLAAPFFISIAFGAPAFITTSYLSWSASNISFLTLTSLFILPFIVFATNHLVVEIYIYNSQSSIDKTSFGANKTKSSELACTYKPGILGTDIISETENLLSIVPQERSNHENY